MTDVLEMFQVAVNNDHHRPTCHARGSLPTGLSPNSICLKLSTRGVEEEIKDKLLLVADHEAFFFSRRPNLSACNYVPQRLSEWMLACLFIYVLTGSDPCSPSTSHRVSYIKDQSPTSNLSFLFFLCSVLFWRKCLVFAHRSRDYYYTYIVYSIFDSLLRYVRSIWGIYVRMHTYPVFLPL